MKSILSAVIGATLALSAIEAGAQVSPGERQVSLTIESTSLATALDKWAQQSGFQIFVQDWEATKNLRAPGLNGTFAAQDALEQLLSGTSLTYVWIDSKTVSIRKRTAQTVPTALQRTSLEGQQIPVAKFSGDGEGHRADYAKAADAGDVRGSGSPQVGQEPRPSEQFEEVIVTGSHIRGLTESILPVTSLDREYIDSTGISTTAKLIESLPQNFALTNQSGVNIPGVLDPRTQGSAINLRGIGQGTTLVLLNGRRMAPGLRSSAIDISALPLSAIERVDVLTDGASALYGSDAIGGVVNFILRDDFSGAETRVRAGRAEGNVDEYRASQAVGGGWDGGRALLSMEYYKRDLLRASERDFIPSTSLIGSLSPRDETYSAVMTAHQTLTDAIDVFVQGLYSNRDSYNEAGRISLNETASTENPQLATTLGADMQIGAGWQIELSGSYARNRSDQVLNPTVLFNSIFEVWSAELKADGPLFDLPGGVVRVALGGDWRSESYKDVSRFQVTRDVFDSDDFDQTVRGVFAEVNAPIVGSANAVPGVSRLELSIAARRDAYSEAGSSVDPQYGLLWAPFPSLRFRANYGTSYKAPSLVDYNVSSNIAVGVFSPDPGLPEGISYQLQVIGIDVGSLAPQESENSSFGVEFAPESIAGLKVGLNYYNIRYVGRIDTPPGPSVMLGNPASFSDLFIRNPTPAQVEEFIAIGNQGQGFLPLDEEGNLIDPFDPSMIQVIVDARKRNLSAVRTKGYDAFLQYAFASGIGDWSLGLSASHIVELEQMATASSEPFSTVDTIYNPADWRVRGSLGWQRGGWAASCFAYYTDSYRDNRVAISVPVSSYTTVDARLAYTFDRGGVTIGAFVQNLFDRDPPDTAVLTLFRDMGFDPTNANPMGRLIGLEFTKSW